MLTGRVCWSQQVSQVRLAVTGALVVFCLTYLVIASRQLHFLKLDRPAGAVVGAVAMVIVGGPTSRRRSPRATPPTRASPACCGHSS
jgi:hypothetical protein